MKGDGPSEGAVGRVVREGLSEEETLSCRDQAWKVRPFMLVIPVSRQPEKRRTSRWLCGGGGRAGRDLVPGLRNSRRPRPPHQPPPRLLAPRSRCHIPPPGWAGAGVLVHSWWRYGEALKAACASLLRDPDNLCAGSAPLSCPRLGPQGLAEDARGQPSRESKHVGAHPARSNLSGGGMSTLRIRSGLTSPARSAGRAS